jgi:hypothetical protein
MDPGPFGCLGVGAPFAMAAKHVHPDKQVLVVYGDGSFGFNGMEFESAARQDLPFVGVVGNDGAWGEMKAFHERVYGADRMVAQDLSQDTALRGVVEALGGYGERVERPEDIGPALDRAAESGCPRSSTSSSTATSGASRRRLRRLTARGPDQAPAAGAVAPARGDLARGTARGRRAPGGGGPWRRLAVLVDRHRELEPSAVVPDQRRVGAHGAPTGVALRCSISAQVPDRGLAVGQVVPMASTQAPSARASRAGVPSTGTSPDPSATRCARPRPAACARA